MNWEDEAKQMYFDEGKSWNEITEYIKLRHFPNADPLKVKERVRSYIRRQPEYKELNKKIDGDKIKVSYNNGQNTFEGKIIKLMHGEMITPEILLKEYNINSKQFEIVSWTANLWQSQVKGGTKLDMYQSKLTVKPKKSIDISIEDIDEYFKEQRYKSIKLPKPKQYDLSGETLVINVADLHGGLLAWVEETGNNYDLKIMRDRFDYCIDDVILRCKNRQFKKIILVNLGDIVHIDNNDQTTTKGTPQQAEGRVQKIIDVLFDMYFVIINRLAEIAPVEFISVAGNHDTVLGYMLAFALKQAYRGNGNITFDISPNPQKARLIGKTLVGFTHGVESKKIQGDWLVSDYRELFGQCKYAEVYNGHDHTQITTEKDTGVIIKGLPALCNQSAWEHLMGYRSYKTMICSIYHDELLLRDTWYSYV